MRWVFRLLAISVTIAIAAVAAVACSGGEPEAPLPETVADGELPDLAGRTVTVAVDNANLPFSYIDRETGRPGGWDYDVIDETCARLGCIPDYRTVPSQEVIEAVASGAVDLAAGGLEVTQDRAGVVDFSDDYMSVDQRVMVAAARTDLIGTDDIVAADCRVGSRADTASYAAAVGVVGQGRVEAYEQLPTAVQALDAGEVCAVIVDDDAAELYLDQNAANLVLLDESVSSDRLAFAFGAGSELVDAFNAALREMKDDGTIDALHEQYFTDAFTVTDDDIARPG